MRRVELVQAREDVAGSHPNGDPAAPVNLLPQFGLDLDHLLIPVTAFVISAHPGRSPHQGEHRPRRIAVVEHPVQVVGHNAPFPHLMISVHLEFGTRKRPFVPEETGENPLFQLHINPSPRIGNKIPRIVHQVASHAGIDITGSFPSQITDVRKILPFDVVETRIDAEIEILRHPEHEIRLHLVLQSLVAAGSRIRSVVITDSPERARERKEIGRETDPVLSPFEQRIVTHAQQIKTGRSNIPEQRDARRLYAEVLFIDPVQSGSHDPDSQFDIGRIVRPPDNTEVQLLRLGLIFVGGFEIAIKTPEEIILPHHRIPRFLQPRHVQMLHRRIP